MKNLDADEAVEYLLKNKDILKVWNNRNKKAVLRSEHCAQL